MRTIVLEVTDLDQISEELRRIGTDTDTQPGPAKRCIVLAEILETGNGLLQESIATEIKNVLKTEATLIGDDHSVGICSCGISELVEVMAAKLENRKTWWAELDDFTDSNTPEP